MNFTEVDKGTNMDVQVRAQDQDQINEFSRNNHRLVEIEEDIKMLKRKLENYNDAADQLDEVSCDYEPGDIKLLIGESFVDVGESAAENFVARQKKAIKADLDSQTALLKTLSRRQADLKKSLYGRFGKAINLEK